MQADEPTTETSQTELGRLWPRRLRSEVDVLATVKPLRDAEMNLRGIEAAAVVEYYERSTRLPALVAEDKLAGAIEYVTGLAA